MTRNEHALFISTPAPMTQALAEEMIQWIIEESAYDFSFRLHKYEGKESDGQTAVVWVRNDIEHYAIVDTLYKRYECIFNNGLARYAESIH